MAGKEPSPDTPSTPRFVQLLARQAVERLRGDLEERGLAPLRPVHVPLLVALLAGGRRASDLAADLRVTRQAVAQSVQVLTAGGFVERVDDPGDARAKLVCLTARGREALRQVRRSAVATEDAWEARIGRERLGEFRSVLVELTAPPGDPSGHRS